MRRAVPDAPETVGMPPVPGVATHVVVMASVVAAGPMRPEPLRPEMAHTHSVQTPCAGMKAPEAPEVPTATPRLDACLANEQGNHDRGTDDDGLPQHSAACRCRSIRADHVPNIRFALCRSNFRHSKRRMMINGCSPV
jgi:hypothetical protein